MPTAQLQLRLHAEGDGPALLVPVESGTVLAPSPALRFHRVVALARACRRVGGHAVAVRWNERAATVHPVYDKIVYGWSWGGHAQVLALIDQTVARGPVSRAVLHGQFLVNRDKREDRSRHDLVTARFAESLGAAEDPVFQRVRDWQTGGPDELAALFETAGKSDVAKVVRLVQAGTADSWLAKLPEAGRKAVRTGPLATVLPVVPVTQGSVPPPGQG
ncbi:hypothetical protein KALB_7054 [Kutzneria albida DSM 43870]|uniref:Uncharacterized protein n=1 Tax=Kutzneria albida DSM 43870 TaxID=1449976 RepID=W5WIJ0_9PSEU|nr:hypothetical protein KALB_7054 [Kutzneria albida DSM 43870]